MCEKANMQACGNNSNIFVSHTVDDGIIEILSTMFVCVLFMHYGAHKLNLMNVITKAVTQIIQTVSALDLPCTIISILLVQIKY